MTAVERSPLAHADQSMTCGPGDRRNAGTVVDHLELERGAAVLDPHGRGPARGVLAGVRQCFLNDPVRGHIERRRQVPSFALDGEGDVETRPLRLGDQVTNPVQTRLRPESLAVSLAPQKAEQALHLLHCGATRQLDRSERFCCLLRAGAP